MRLVYSNYDKESGKSTILMEHEGKQYMGNAYFNKEEEKYPPNAFFGLRIAEKRAIIEYWKEMKNINRIKARAMESLLKDLQNTKENLPCPYEGNPIVEKIERHLRYYKQEAANYQFAIDSERKGIKKDIEVRQKFLKSL